jgi:hypothetical protein
MNMLSDQARLTALSRRLSKALTVSPSRRTRMARQVAAIGGRGCAIVRRQRTERDLATFLGQSLDLLGQSHLALRP